MDIKGKAVTDFAVKARPYKDKHGVDKEFVFASGVMDLETGDRIDLTIGLDSVASDPKVKKGALISVTIQKLESVGDSGCMYSGRGSFV